MKITAFLSRLLATVFLISCGEPIGGSSQESADALFPASCLGESIPLALSGFTFEGAGAWGPSDKYFQRSLLLGGALSRQIDITARRGTTLQARFSAFRGTASTSPLARARLIVRDAQGAVLAEASQVIASDTSPSEYKRAELSVLPIAISNDAATLEVRFDSEDEWGLFVSDDIELFPHFEDREQAIAERWVGVTPIPAEGCRVKVSSTADQRLCTTRFGASATLHVRYRSSSKRAGIEVFGAATHNKWTIASQTLPVTNGFETVSLATTTSCGTGYTVRIYTDDAPVEIDALWATAQ